MTEKTRKALEIVRLAAELGEYDSNVIGMAAESSPRKNMA